MLQWYTQRSLIFALLLGFSSSCLAWPQFDKLKQPKVDPTTCTRDRLTQLQNALDELNDGGVVDSAFPRVLRELRLTQKACGALKIDPSKLNDEQLKAALMNPPKSLIVKASAASENGFSLRKVVNACALLVNLSFPDPSLTGPECLPDLQQEQSASSSKASGTAPK
jgi:hypothetical protein